MKRLFIIIIRTVGAYFVNELILASAFPMLPAGSNSHSPWFLAALCLLMIAIFSTYLVYSWKVRKIYTNVPGFKGDWIYRDEDPAIYWFYMAMCFGWDIVSIWQFIVQLHKLSH